MILFCIMERGVRVRIEVEVRVHQSRREGTRVKQAHSVASNCFPGRRKASHPKLQQHILELLSNVESKASAFVA